MDTTNAIVQLESAVQRQLLLAGNDPAVEDAAAMVVASLEPALTQLATDLAEQAAAEVSAQLADHEVEVVMSDGEPHLRVRPLETAAAAPTEGYEARLTVRLPENLKELIEESAGVSGDSVNTWVVKTLNTKTKRSKRRGNRFEGTIEI